MLTLRTIKLLDFQKQQASNLDILDQTLDFIYGHYLNISDSFLICF